MRIPFADLKRGTESLRGELDAAAARVLDSGWYVLGDEGRSFEQEFADFVGSRFAVGVASGTDAIELALRALGVGPGDEVVTQANTCVPTIAGIERTGAAAVLCDVEPEAATMDPESLLDAIGPSTKAIVPVHLYGQCADVDAILEVAGDIAVVEDCAQAHGAELRGRNAGTMGALGCFSFYPTKNLGALGDGGAVTTDDEGLAERLRLLRQYGQTDRYSHVERGVNSRLDELQAALLRVKLAHLRAGNERRAEIAAAYDDALSGTSTRPLARLPERRHVFHLYVTDVPDRESFQTRLSDAGVGTLVHYPKPVHGHPPYRSLGDGPVRLANSERLSTRVVSLPMYPELRDDEVEHVRRSVQEASH
jgi:dTDP-4-amino-4,6-dideoxygalactose transaminase